MLPLPDTPAQTIVAPQLPVSLPHRCRRCGYDLVGLPAESSDLDGADARPDRVCPECALPLRLSRGPLIAALDPRSLSRLEWGGRFVSIGAGLWFAAAAMLAAMFMVGSHHWLDPFSVESLNAVVIGCCIVGWLSAAHGGRLLVFREPIRQRRTGLTFAVLMFCWPVVFVAWPLIPFVLLALPIVTVVRIRQLGRAVNPDFMPAWADVAAYIGLSFVVITYLFACAYLPQGDADAWVAAFTAGVAFEIFALAFRSAARDIRRHRTAAERA